MNREKRPKYNILIDEPNIKPPCLIFLFLFVCFVFFVLFFFCKKERLKNVKGKNLHAVKFGSFSFTARKRVSNITYAQRE